MEKQEFQKAKEKLGKTWPSHKRMVLFWLDCADQECLYRVHYKGLITWAGLGRFTVCRYLVTLFLKVNITKINFVITWRLSRDPVRSLSIVMPVSSLTGLRLVIMLSYQASLENQTSKTTAGNTQSVGKHMVAPVRAGCLHVLITEIKSR